MTTSTEWQLAGGAARRYQEVLVPAILGPVARALVDWSDLQAGEAVVDIGCGTGAAARAAAEKVGPSGRVAGIDVNPGMINEARSLGPVNGVSVEWIEQNAHALSLQDGSFDVALLAQTLQFLSDRPAALAELRRILKPGGRLVLSLWCDRADNPYFDALISAVARHIGAETAAGLSAAFSLSSPESIRSTLGAGGFSQTDAEVADLPLHLPPLQEFVPGHIGATPMAAAFEAAEQQVQQHIVTDVAAQLTAYATGTGVRIPFRTRLVCATSAHRRNSGNTA